jgi:hypothetical protein
VTTPRAARLILAATVATLLLAGCLPGPQGMASAGEAVGLVTDVQGSGPAAVDHFTLRTDDGRLLTLKVDPARLSADSFVPAHLREHLASGEKVLVSYEGEGDQLVATRLADAP